MTLNAKPLNATPSNATIEKAPEPGPLDGIIVRHTLMTEAGMRVANKYILEEAPRYRLIHFGNDTLYIPLPWIYYVIMNWQIADMWASPVQASEGICPVSSIPLPNIYEGRPCYTPRGSVNDPPQIQIINAINTFWEARFNHDGTRLETLPVWNKLAHEIEAAGGVRADVLLHWERLSIEEVLALPWPQDKKLDVGPPL